MASEGGTKSVLLTEPVEDPRDPSPVPQNEAGSEGDRQRYVGNRGDSTNLSGQLERVVMGESRLIEENDTKSERSYQPPTEDPYKKAVKYMEMHNVMQIFQHLTSEIVFHRPVDPLDYMLEELQRMKDAKIRELNS